MNNKRGVEGKTTVRCPRKTKLVVGASVRHQKVWGGTGPSGLIICLAGGRKNKGPGEKDVDNKRRGSVTTDRNV